MTIYTGTFLTKVLGYNTYELDFFLGLGAKKAPRIMYKCVQPNMVCEKMKERMVRQTYRLGDSYIPPKTLFEGVKQLYGLTICTSSDHLQLSIMNVFLTWLGTLSTGTHMPMSSTVTCKYSVLKVAGPEVFNCGILPITCLVAVCTYGNNQCWFDESINVFEKL